MLLKKNRLEVENDWDYRSVPAIPLRNHKLKQTAIPHKEQQK